MKTEYRCIIISDTHGDDRAIFKVIEKEEPFDLLIHCGDVQGNLDRILGVQRFGYFSVRGNCDMFADADDERCIRLGSWNVFVTHGHRYDVRYGRDRLIRAGQSHEAHVILYGHTHVPDVTEDEKTGILIVNPGSLSRPRQSSHIKTYAVLKFSAKARPEAEIMEF